MDSIRTVAVLAGGAPVDPALLGPLPRLDMVIAADSGIAQAPLLGLGVDLLVGDLDSADPADVSAAIAAGTNLERHPADKDATDLALAVAAAVRAGAQRLLVIGGYGGHLDHLLGNALLLGSSELADVAVEWWVGPDRTHVVRRHTAIHGNPGDVVSLLAIGGVAGGIVTDGLRWPLAGDDLPPGSTRGVSNEMLTDAASVTVGSGVLLAVHRRQA